MRAPSIPESAQIVRTYAEYEKFIQAFFDGCYDLLIVIGRAGLSKSSAFEERLEPTSHLIRGFTTPLKAYLESYEHRHKRIIFDDAESLWKWPSGRILMRSLCESKTEKLVQWASTCHELEKAGVPERFLTTSRVALVMNQLAFGDEAEREAILDRAHTIVFEPYPAELHRQVASWFWDQDIFDYLGQRLHLIRQPSSWLYRKAWDRLQAGDDWKKMIDECYCHGSTTREVQNLESDLACPTVAEKVVRFIERTGASRATYFNIKAQLKEAGQLVPLPSTELLDLKLRGVPPERPNVQDEIARAQTDGQGQSNLPADMPEQSGDILRAPAGRDEDIPGAGRLGDSLPRLPGGAAPDDDLLAWLACEFAKAIRQKDHKRAVRLREQLARYRTDDGQEV